MATVSFKGQSVHTVGDLPALGSQTPEFKLTKSDLSEISHIELHGKRVVINIFPSIDTPVCGESVRRFNQAAEKLPNTVVLCVSMDLPFAQSRFCAAEGLKNVVTASDFKHQEFGHKFGVRIRDGGLSGLLSRAVVILDENGKVLYTEQVEDLSKEPNYEKALMALQQPVAV